MAAARFRFSPTAKSFEPSPPRPPHLILRPAALSVSAAGPVNLCAWSGRPSSPRGGGCKFTLCYALPHALLYTLVMLCFMLALRYAMLFYATLHVISHASFKWLLMQGPNIMYNNLYIKTEWLLVRRIEADLTDSSTWPSYNMPSFTYFSSDSLHHTTFMSTILRPAGFTTAFSHST